MKLQGRKPFFPADGRLKGECVRVCGLFLSCWRLKRFTNAH
jgi:hypothetical protein